MGRTINLEQAFITELIDCYQRGCFQPLSSETRKVDKFDPNLKSINLEIFEYYGNTDSEQVLSAFGEIYRRIWSLEHYRNLGDLEGTIERIRIDNDYARAKFIYRILKLRGTIQHILLELKRV